MKLVPLSEVEDRFSILYRLMEERTPDQSISHKGMPTFEEHEIFVNSDPYLAWYFIVPSPPDIPCGAIYLTRQREIGISIFKKYRAKGYGKQAIAMLMKRHPGKFLANINPENIESIRLFENFGFKHIQNTYALHDC